MIFVSPGHYPAKPGAVYEGFVEHEEAVIWAQKIAEALHVRACLVPALILQQKVEFINARAGQHSIALEVHFNDATKWIDRNKDGIVTEDELEHVGEGAETLYCPGSAKGIKLATIVQASIDQLFPFRWTDRNKDGKQQPDELEGRGIKEGWYRMNKANGPDFILERTRCPTVIVEPEFVQRKDRILKNRDEACAALAAALLAAEEELA